MTTELKFTGERFVPGKASHSMEEDHLARYRFAARFVRGLRFLILPAAPAMAQPCWPVPERQA